MKLNSIDNVRTMSNGNSSYYFHESADNFVVEESLDIKSDIDGEMKQDHKNTLDQKQFEQGDINKKELDKSLKKLNGFLKEDSVHAEYSVHEDFGTVMIKIVDDITKEVILEVPPKKILDMVASICKQFGLIDKKA